MSDAAVTLRSLPRRYKEIVAGPVGDDAWERIVRKAAANNRSALGWVQHSAELITALGTAVAALPLQAKPTCDVQAITDRRSEPRATMSIDEVIANLRDVAERAAIAIQGRQHDDFDRNCLVDGHELSAADLVRQIVTSAVAHLKDAEQAKESAKNSLADS